MRSQSNNYAQTPHDDFVGVQAAEYNMLIPTPADTSFFLFTFLFSPIAIIFASPAFLTAHPSLLVSNQPVPVCNFPLPACHAPEPVPARAAPLPHTYEIP